MEKKEAWGQLGDGSLASSVSRNVTGAVGAALGSSMNYGHIGWR